MAHLYDEGESSRPLTLEQIDAKMAANTTEIANIRESLAGRAAAQVQIFKRYGGRAIIPQMLERGLTNRLAYLEDQQKRLAQKRTELAGSS